MIHKIFIAFLIITGITACTKNNHLPYEVDNDWNKVKSSYKTYQEICGSVSDAVRYPDPWTEEISETFVIPDEIILSMSTCGLLSTYLSHPERKLGPWCMECSYSYDQGVTYFNNLITQNRVVIEFLKRDDCPAVLAAQYIAMIEKGEEKAWRRQCFEMLLASDACMSVLNTEQKVQFMVMAIKMAESSKKQLNETRHIMVAIMKAFNYSPFLTEADTEKYSAFGNSGGNSKRTGLSENTWGYDVCNFDIVEKSAKEFMTDKNLSPLRKVGAIIYLINLLYNKFYKSGKFHP